MEESDNGGLAWRGIYRYRLPPPDETLGVRRQPAKLITPFSLSRVKKHSWKASIFAWGRGLLRSGRANEK